MRPLYLEIEGVKSITDKQTINFEKVAKSGIFGIFGKTGSGKTTILDSIVLALYGDTTSSVDNKDFINLEKNVARVTLIFVVDWRDGARTFRVERQYKLDKKRQNPTSTAKLWEKLGDDEICLEEGTSKVNKKLENDIIGLTKRDFLKCIALPQGAFSEFIKLTRSERLTFVGKLFGLEKYGKPLADKVSAKLRQLRDEEIKESGKLSTFEQCDEKVIAESKENVEKITKELELAKRERDVIKAEYELKKALYEAGESRSKKIAEYNKKLAYKPVIDGLVEKIRIYDTLFLVKKEIQTLQRATRELKDLEKQIKEHDENNKNLIKRKNQAQKEQALLPDLQENLMLLSSKRALVNDIQPKIEALDNKRKELDKLRKDYKKYTAEKQQLESKMNERNVKREEYLELAKKYDVKKALLQLESKISGEAIKSYAQGLLQFLNRLKQLLSQENLVNESAVNQLIAGEIAKIEAILNKDGENIESSFLSECIFVLDKNSEYLTKAQEVNNESVACKAQIEAVEKLIENSLQLGTAVKKECDQLQEEISAVLGAKTAVEVLKQIDDEILQTSKRIEKINNELIEVEKNINDCAIKLNELQFKKSLAEKDINEAQFAVEDALESVKVTFSDALKILENGEQVQNDRAVVESYNRELERLSDDIGQLNEKLKDGVVSNEDYLEICRKYQEVQENVENINKNFGEINLKHEILLKNYKDWCIINSNLLTIKSEQTIYSKAYELVKESRFMEFIAEVYLREIAFEAENRVLSLTSGRYGLVYKNGNFFVTDNLSGGRERPVLGLSGGETFLVSLSLALALSSQISRKALKKLDFFFLDEGFGTLDDDLVDAVANSLEKLQKANLTVGLITHVNELKNRISSRIEVTGATPLHGTLISDNC